MCLLVPAPIQWRHNGRDGISNHPPHHCLLNLLFRRRSKKTSKFRVTDLCAGNSPLTGEFPAQRASNAENVSIWWHHHGAQTFLQQKLQCFEICSKRSNGHLIIISHADVIKWKHFARYWPFVRGIHRLPVNFPHKGQWRGALMFSLICAWKNGWVNNGEAGDLGRHRAHYDVTVMNKSFFFAYMRQQSSRGSNELLHYRTKIFNLSSKTNASICSKPHIYPILMPPQSDNACARQWNVGFNKLSANVTV